MAVRVAHSCPICGQSLKSGTYKVIVSRQTIVIDGVTFRLRKNTFQYFLALARYAPRPVGHWALAELTSSEREDSDHMNRVRVMINGLRSDLAQTPLDGLVKIERGAGYYLDFKRRPVIVEKRAGVVEFIDGGGDGADS